MSKITDTKNKLKSKLEAIKKINDDPKGNSDALFDKYLKDLPSTDKLFGKKLDDFLDKRKKKKSNKKDIFSEVIDVVEGFLGSSKKVAQSDKLMSKSRLKQHAHGAAEKTLTNGKQIILDSVKKVFFAGDGICGGNSAIASGMDTVTIKPGEIDLMNVLTVDPSSTLGQIMYETATPDRKKEKVNRGLYESFTGPDYQFDTNSNRTLFKMKWSDANQEFTVSGLTQGLSSVPVESFLNDYFSSVELPDITGITKTAMLMTLKSDPSAPPLFDKGFNDIDRLLKKLSSICGSPNKSAHNVNDLQQDAKNQFDESDEDIEFYFNFDDVEGIDLDDEDARFKKVLRFADCNNFEVPLNPDILEDFVYLSNSGKKTLNDLVNSTLSKTASDVYEQSDSSIPLENFHLSLLNSYILSLPKAMISSLLTPKIFLPIVIIYKLFKLGVGQVIKVAELMKKLYKLFAEIIKQLFWSFIKEFWNLIKPDLILFLIKLVKKILKNKYSRYVVIITALIALLTKLLAMKLDNCFAIFNAILSAINGALSVGGGFNIPGFLLGFSHLLPGYSQDRAMLNISERMESAGISLSPLYGEANDIPAMVKSIIDGHTEEHDTNGFIKVSNQLITIPTPVGPIVIPPGILSSSGKAF